MNSPYLHIVTVHLPVILTPVVTIWMLTQLKIQNEKTWKYLFLSSILIAVLTSIAYFTGPATADYAKNIVKNYPQDWVENHALWGRIAFILQVFSGLISIMGLSSMLQDEKPSPKFPYLLLIINVINIFVLVYTAHLGGMIRRMDLI